MKSTILQIIVKQWFEDKSVTELDDAVIDAIIKELTEKKDNRITITDIEPKSSRIHYESKKDAEEIPTINDFSPKEESDWIGVEDKMPEVKGIQSEQITFLTLGDKIIDGYSNGRKFYDADGIIHRFVTHWRHLPEPPKNN